MDPLKDDLNFPKALSELQQLEGAQLIASAQFLGLLQQNPAQWFKGDGDGDSAIQALIDARTQAKRDKNWSEADRIRDELKAQGIILEDRPGGTTDWRRG
jgi:cysteinyl-tRNA synthetase